MVPSAHIEKCRPARAGAPCETMAPEVGRVLRLALAVVDVPLCGVALPDGKGWFARESGAGTDRGEAFRGAQTLPGFAELPLWQGAGGAAGRFWVADRTPRPEFQAARAQTLEDLRDLVVQTIELAHAARTDALTGAAARGHFFAELERQAAWAAGHLRPLSLVLLDIDHFKAVNDRFGHRIGDEVLAGVAGRVAGVLRRRDLLGRLGGEEFAVLLSDTPIAAARRVAGRICRAVAQRPFASSAGPVAITVSLGVSPVAMPGGAPDAALDAADRELYRAKTGGRNRICIAAPGGAAAISGCRASALC